MSNIRARFGNQLRTIRTAREISQEELAHRAGLHRTYISSVERGERNVTLETIEKLAKSLQLPMAKFMPD